MTASVTGFGAVARAGRVQHRTDAGPAPHGWDDLRFTVSWKGYRLSDGAEGRAWGDHADDLTVDVMLDRLEADLRSRVGLAGDRPPRREFAAWLIRE